MTIKFEDITHLFSVDFDALRRHVQHLEATLPKAGGAMFNGWTVMSRGGSYKEAWVDGSQFFKKGPTGKLIFDIVAAHRAGFYPNREHTRYTDASCSELIKLVERAKELGLSPCRARLIQLVPGATSSWHTDGTPDKQVLRLHAVIQTNKDATFTTEGGAQHLEQDKLFLINVNFYHSVQNNGSTPRTHLVIDVTDTRKISRVH